MANKEPRGQKEGCCQKKCPYQTKATGETEEVDVLDLPVETAQRTDVGDGHGH